MCQRSTCFARGIFVDIRRGILEERYQTSYHVRKLKNSNGWLFLCDTWLRYLKKLQFMLTETHQISNLRSQDVSKEVLSDLVRKNAAEFSDKSFHFQYATLEMLKGALNDYSMLKLLLNQHPPFCIYFIVELPQNGVEQCLSFLFATAFLLRSLFSFEK